MRLHNKQFVVYPPMVNRFFKVYDGRAHYKLTVRDFMISHKMGEFMPTRQEVQHNRRKKEKALAKKLKEEAKKAGKTREMSAEQKKRIEEMKRKRKKRK